MFIIHITYTVSLDEVDKHLNAHIDYLNEQYALGNFIASGRKVPRTGGVILSQVSDRSTVESIIAKDPFYRHQLANYELIEFVPSKTNDALAFLREDKTT